MKMSHLQPGYSVQIRPDISGGLQLLSPSALAGVSGSYYSGYSAIQSVGSLYNTAGMFINLIGVFSQSLGGSRRNRQGMRSCLPSFCRWNLSLVHSKEKFISDLEVVNAVD